MEYKTEFAFDRLPDVDSFHNKVVCGTISQVKGPRPILAWSFLQPSLLLVRPTEYPEKSQKFDPT